MILYDGSASITATELFLTTNTTVISAKTDVGPIQVLFDLTTLVAGDQFLFKTYEKCRTGDAQIVFDSRILSDKQAVPGSVPFAVQLEVGWDMSLQRLSATNRIIGWSIRKS